MADGPVPVAQFAAALEATPRTIEAALDELDAIYEHRGLRIQRDKAGIQLTTAPQTAEAVEKFLGLESLQRLSKPAVETLAIIAYQQPITRPRIEAIRGVNSDGVIKSLLTKGLIEEMGRTEGPGRPVLYGTTPTFLQHFGLSSLTDLPPLDIEAVLAAARITGPESEAAPAPLADAEPEAVAAAETAEPIVDGVTLAEAALDADAEPEPRPETDTQSEVEAETPTSISTTSEAEPVPETTPEPEVHSEAGVETSSILSTEADVEPELELPALMDELTQTVSDVELLKEPIVEASDDDDDEDDEDDDDDDWDEGDDDDDEDEPDEAGSPSAGPQEPQS